MFWGQFNYGDPTCLSNLQWKVLHVFEQHYNKENISYYSLVWKPLMIEQFARYGCVPYCSQVWTALFSWDGGRGELSVKCTIWQALQKRDCLLYCSVVWFALLISVIKVLFKLIVLWCNVLYKRWSVVFSSVKCSLQKMVYRIVSSTKGS